MENNVYFELRGTLSRYVHWQQYTQWWNWSEQSDGAVILQVAKYRAGRYGNFLKVFHIHAYIFWFLFDVKNCKEKFDV